MQVWLDVNVDVLCDGIKYSHFSVAKLKIVDSIAFGENVITKTLGLQIYLKTTWSTIITETQVLIFPWDFLDVCSISDGTQLNT